MRRNFLFILTFVFVLNYPAYSQVYNTAQTLRSGSGSIGFNGTIYSDDLGLFLHGGYGLNPGFDLGIKLGVGLPKTYIGFDLEWLLRGNSPYISIALGGHSFVDPGIDATLNFSVPAGRKVMLYTGVDGDLNFAETKKLNVSSGKIEEETDLQAPMWFFFGAEILIRHAIVLQLEVNLELTDEADGLINAGLNFYL